VQATPTEAPARRRGVLAAFLKNRAPLVVPGTDRGFDIRSSAGAVQLGPVCPVSVSGPGRWVKVAGLDRVGFG
jgi:hypothetical protein